ncbi:D-alanyl-D-alanine carboxypeptidase [Streptomyces sp. NBC_01478]|uniref:D-alanyl-D-alanine carboxypeptidase n=1 Tax=Streptomyces sp. NBC_01478 TaxID=2903882 RepID=UPI002E325E09|nr:D-alanyl-D-alanine carboxypeptidase [Streptomyces sp. NBC_01478]
MEEASVAGESPDKSKQRESSAEPTPGSASPVPEARGERDPRLAVTRDDTAPSAAVQRGGVDTATKIFSIRELRTETDPETDAAPSDDAEASEGGPEGDARLRAAVAAWVTSGSAGEKPTRDETADATDETEDPGGAAGAATAEDGSEGDSEGAETPAGGLEDGPGEDAGATSVTDASGAPESDEGDEGDEGDEAHDSAAAEAEGEPVSDAEDTSPADKTPTAVKTDEADEVADAHPAADSASGDAPKADETAEAGPAEAEADATDADADADADAGTAPKPADGKSPVEATDPKTDDRPESTDGESPSDATAPKTDARPKPAEGRATSDATAPKTDSRPETAEGDTAADPRVTGTTGTTGTKDATRPPKAADGDSPPQAPPAPDNATRTGGAGGKTKAGDGEAEPEVLDHPTAVFKAPRPPKPAVDQPTTMLKAPKVPETPKAPKAPETPAERTSKFVALKPLDEPRRDTPRPDTTRSVPHLGPEHTTQQPLPPKPPLDLLAELTNTPPPPQTPVRTAIRRVKIWTPLVLLLAIVFAVVQALRPLPTPALTLTADDSYTFAGTKADLPWPSEGQGWMDVNGIGTMGNFGKQTPVAIGSVAKAMTAYIVLKDHPLKAGAEGAKITVDATAEKEGGYDKDGESTLNTVKAGDVLTEKQALSAIMIPSANNIARLLARWDAGSEAAFIKKMNDTAKALGMTNTTYTDASGLKETTVSTAEDQVKLGNQLVKIQALMDITKLPSWIDPSGKKWTNYNRLVPYNNSLGIKTGTTTAAGGNLLFAATKEVGGETAVVVGAILGQHTAPIIDTVNAVSKTAMLAAQDAMTSAKILKKGTVVGYVDDQLGGHTPVVVTKDVAAVGWAGLKVELSFAPDAVPHTAKAGTKVGTLTVGDGSSGAVKVPVALQKDLAEPALTAKLTRLG